LAKANPNSSIASRFSGMTATTTQKGFSQIKDKWVGVVLKIR